MGRYIVTLEKDVDELLELIDDEDLIREISYRINDRLIIKMLQQLDTKSIELIRKYINESN